METSKGLVLLSAFLLSCCVAKNLPSYAGPYRMHVDRMAPCEDKPLNWTFAFRVSHYNPYKPTQLQIVTGNVTFTDTVDDTFWADLRFAVRANNEWKRNAFVLRFPTKACSVWRSEFPCFYFALFKTAPKTGPCSFAAGTYPVDDPVDWVLPSIPIFPYGNYLAILKVGRPGVKEASICLDYYGQVLPKT